MAQASPSRAMNCLRLIIKMVIVRDQLPVAPGGAFGDGGCPFTDNLMLPNTPKYVQMGCWVPIT